MERVTKRPAVTVGTRPGGRSERVVRSVLKAAAEELSLSGFTNFRVEEVALRAAVAKTTIYRRWPTKTDLVAAMLHAPLIADDATVDTGSLRGDLLETLRRGVAKGGTPEGRAAIRMVQAEIENPEVAELVRVLRRARRKAFREVVKRAVARGELAPTVDSNLLLDMIMGPVHGRMRLGEPVPASLMESVVDIVVAGFNAAAAPPRR
ncbi:MAG: TetR/AcrR family transcriptional regulator [Polyangiaceae bacterium]|nr:TetR/AcrR family transcriptional regulator [Polyangiaceae bacterium]